ncbi:MAG: 30S ribosomal protein S15 [Candidatus Paceibacterota bacterium]
MLTKRKKQKAISEAKISEKDTGSTGVQISLLSKKIDELAKHLKKHQKDNSSRKGLLQMVADRRKLVKYLQAKDVKKYNALAKKLDLKLAK